MASYTFLGNPPPNVQKWIEKTYLTIYKVQTTSQYKKTGIYSAQRDNTSKPVVINWGDGTVEEVDGDVSQKVHEYSSEGEFTVKVSNIKTFAASINNTTWNNTTSQNGYTLKELVNLNKAMTSIESYAFWGCANMTSVTIPDGVTSIRNNAFASCSGLTSVMIPNGVTSIGDSAFYSCSSLTSVTIGNCVTSIGEFAFYGCYTLTSIIIPNSVTSIGQYAFRNCRGLKSVTMPNSMTSIGIEAFLGCNGLTAVHITDVAKWCSISFFDSLANPLYYAHNLYLNGEKITDLVIPDGVTSIGQLAFKGCSSLESAAIPDSVTSIGSAAFYDCHGLTSVTFDSTSVPAEGYNCFCNTSNLNDIYMLNISVSDVQAELDSNISRWYLGVNSDDTYHTVTIHCMDGEVVIDPTPSGSSGY